MATLHFFYGVMGSSKSALLGINAFNFNHTGNSFEVIKPQTDNRDSTTEIVSRIGVKTPATALKTLKNYIPKPETQFVLIDEVQFFTPKDIDRLVAIADSRDIRIMCYGLMIDSNEKMFPAAKRLVEVGAKLHRMESVCQIDGCTHLATHHLRFDNNGNVIHRGQQIAIGADQYLSTCRKHFNEMYYKNYKTKTH
ncbi:MAG: thymidine kinase [Alphaproteobacteria bacterium]|nr:thymidine kinase [Alphaproteobacteria bacterium]